MIRTWAIIGFILAAIPSPGPADDAGDPVVGAIRWDGWYGDRGVVGRTVQESLGPNEWHYRLPFYGKVVGDNQVEIDGTSQEVVDREIEYAAAAGLDYWAFVTYPADDPLSLGIKRYLSSPIRSKINFCLITECGRWHQPAFVDRVVSLMQEPGYQKVLGRPLLYLGFIEPEKLDRFAGGIEGFRKLLDEFRSTVVGKGLGRPYIVVMDFHAEQGKKWADALGCEAISSYATGWEQRTISYSQLAANAERFWDQCRDTGAQVVPIVMAGWDRRPRVEKPMPWEPWQQVGVGLDRYSRPGQPVEIANHLNRAIKWLRDHPTASRARTIVIYAWNEFDEGGWLTPTLTEGAARLEAIGRVLSCSPSSRTAGGAAPVTSPGG